MQSALGAPWLRTGILLCTALVACQHMSPRLPPDGVARAAVHDVAADSVLALWDAMNAAWDRGDTIAVGRVFAPDLRAATSAGRVLGREDILKYIAAAGPDTGRAAGLSQIHDKRVQLLGAHGDVAVCTAEATDVIEVPSGLDTIVTRVTDVFERRARGWELVAAHESYVRPPRTLPGRWRVNTSAAAIVPASASAVSARFTVRNRYYARPGKREDVYRWRLHASDVLRQLGLTPGVVFRGAGGAEPDAVWEVTLDSAALMREGAAAAASPKFQAVMRRMGGLIRRFESTTSRETRRLVEKSAGADAESVGSLERAARAWITHEQDAFAQKDAAAFQPCPDSAAIVLRDVGGTSHTCIAVQRHMRDRMAEMQDGAMRVRIDSVAVRGDTGVVYDAVHFERTVRHADGSMHRHASDAAHGDVWSRTHGSWHLDRMEELDAPVVTVDGERVAPAAVQRASSAHPYLFVWTGGRGSSEFMATIDADSTSATYGRVVATAPTGVAGAPHHTEHELPASGHLLANDFHAGRTWLFDLHDPLHPAVLSSFGDVAGYSHPHTFVRMGDGRVLATFQYRADSSTAATGSTMSMRVMPTHTTGGLVLMDERGTAVRSGSAADPHIHDRLLFPYSVLPLGTSDRAVSTTTDMDHADTVATSEWIQLWRLSDLKLLRSIALPPGPRGTENRLSGEARLLPDGRSIYVHTFSCGLYLLRGAERDQPVATFVYGFDGDDCGVPILTGHYWLQTVPAMHGVIVLDVTDAEHPREVSRVSVGEDESPHWIAIDRTGRRIVLNSGGRGNRLFILAFDPATGAITVDQRFRDVGSDRPGIVLSGANWPSGFVGNVVPHGAVFSR